MLPSLPVILRTDEPRLSVTAPVVVIAIFLAVMSLLLVVNVFESSCTLLFETVKSSTRLITELFPKTIKVLPKFVPPDSKV